MKSLQTFIFLLTFTISISPSTLNELFSLQKKGGDIINYLISSKFSGDLHLSVNKTLEELTSKNLKLIFASNDSIRLVTSYVRFKEENNLFHYVSVDKTYWLDIKYCQSSEEMKSFWKKLSFKKRRYTGVEYLASKIGYTLSADSNVVFAIIKTKNMIFNIGLDLPIKDTKREFEKLTEAEQNLIFGKTNELIDIIKIIAKHFVKEEEQIFLPITDRELNQSERLIGFFKFWNEVKYNFAFFDHVPNLDWDKTLIEYLLLIQKDQSTLEYYKTLQKLCALLNDGHTNVYFPNYIQGRYDKPQIEIKNFQNKAYITNISQTLKDKIDIGAEIIEVDGIPVTKYLQEYMFPFYATSTEYIKWDWCIRDLLDGIESSKVEIKIKNKNGMINKIALTRNSRSSNEDWLIKQERNWKPFEFKWLDDNIAYIALNEFQSDSGVKGFENSLNELKKAKGLIIDLRQNEGGDTENGTKIIEYLTDKTFLTSKWKTREMRSAFRAWGQYYKDFSEEEIEKLDRDEKEEALLKLKNYNGNNWFEGDPMKVTPKNGEKINCPLVVLLGHNTASAAEDFLVSLDYLKKGTFVGDNSFGSTGQPFIFPLPGGGSARVCTKRDYYPDGREFVGYGIKPHVYVEQTLKDYLNNYDRVLEKGKEILKNKL
jgi:C-terminal processing protease CtpA/Prc